jgi:hypothetical protein
MILNNFLIYSLTLMSVINVENDDVEDATRRLKNIKGQK